MYRRLALLAILALPLAALAAAEPPAYNTSDTCGTCHRDIHRTWAGSVHARSLENPVFLEAFRGIQIRDREKARVCVGCHAPMAGVTGDEGLERRVTWEGVTCDYCHSIADVTFKGTNPVARVEVGDVKRGPIRDADSMVHEVTYSELHTGSLVCAPCHEYTNGEGQAVLTTYSEWLESEAKTRGDTCQSCHMALARANVVDPRIRRTPHEQINLHEMPGARSLQQLHKALRTSMHFERGGDSVLMEVRIRNIGAGHAVPTGMPGRRIVMRITVTTSSGQRHERERVLAKLFEDGDGNTVSRIEDYFGPGVTLKTDTRIRPDETRVESFRFPIPITETAYVSLSLHYEYEPLGPGHDHVRVNFHAEQRQLRGKSGGT